MTLKSPHRAVALMCTLSLLHISNLSAQTAPRPAPPDTALAAQPAPSPSPVRGIRGKLSAADLLSAESILDVFRREHGETDAYVSGLGWLARGALLMGEPERARHYAAGVRAVYAERMAGGVDLAEAQDLETAIGAAIEVEAQLLASERGADAAVAHLQSELSRIHGPVALRSRLYKRINLLSMAGSPAPELEIEDFVGAKPPLLASLRGKPVVLFAWNPACGDCAAQAPELARLRRRYGAQGLQLVTLTRFYRDGAGYAAEKARVDSVWKDVYADVGTVPMVISTASMERFGGSSTPTYVFMDRDGVVRHYEPYRLTESEFDRRVKEILADSHSR